VRIKTALAVVALLAFPALGASTFYLDFEGGNDANDGTSFANRWKTIDAGATAARIAPGDTIRIMGSLSPGSLGNATWTDNTKTVVLATACTELISACDADWTASADVTCSTSTTRKEGTKSASFVFASGFLTGLAAYSDIADTTTLDGYQQISFWIQSNAVVAANTFKISLCSDDSGAVEVDTFTIPFAINPVNAWHRVTVNKGSNLGDPIKSVALYCLLDPGTPTILIDDIFAVKAVGSADELSLSCLVSKTNGIATAVDVCGWYGINYVNGTTIGVGLNVGGDPGVSGVNYRETTATVTTYATKCIMLTPVIDNNNTWGGSIQDSGTDGSQITFSGGWNRTDMTTQTYMTWLGSPNAFGRGINTNQKNYVTMGAFGISGGGIGLYLDSGSVCVFTDLHLNSSAQALNYRLKANATLATRVKINGSQYGYTDSSASNFGDITNVFVDCTFQNLYGNDSAASFTASNNYFFKNCRLKNAAWGCSWVASKRAELPAYTFDSCKFSYMGTTNKSFFMYSPASLSIYNCLLDGTPEVTFLRTGVGAVGAFLFSQDHNQVPNAVKIYCSAGTIENESVVRHTASGYSWKCTIATSANTSKSLPIMYRIYNKSTPASVAATVSAYMRKNHADMHCWLYLPLQPGISAEAYSSAEVSATGAWEQLSVTFTPSATVVVSIYAIFYATSDTRIGYVDDVSKTP